MRFLWLRRIYQVVFLGVFVFLIGITTASWLGGYPVEWFLGVDPLAALTSALAAGSITTHLLWAVPLTVLTMVFGRFFCGWICPMGTLHHSIGWIGRRKRVKEQITSNSPKPAYKVKYFVLLAMLGMALAGSMQIGLLDPIAFMWRALSTSVIPALDNTAMGVYQGVRHFHTSTLILACFIAVLALNLFIPRLYCRMLCPLGALLGLFARFSLFRLRRRVDSCKDCNVCGSQCQGAANPQGALQVSECMLCLNCQLSCPRDGIQYRFLPSPDLATDRLDLGRRRWLTSFVGGVAAVPLIRTSDGVEPRAHPRRIRPPGSLEESAFLERCLKCGACMKVCPTGGLQPALHEAGLEGLWTPILVPRLGYCEQDCVLCSAVCPTGAIRELTLAKKKGESQGQEAIRIGTAFIDRGRCLPWSMDTPCIICEEVCPTAPKAVHYKTVEIQTRAGKKRILKRPQVDPQACIGCGVCESACVVVDEPAIRVSSVGETRDPRNRLVLSKDRI